MRYSNVSIKAVYCGRNPAPSLFVGPTVFPLNQFKLKLYAADFQSNPYFER